MTCGTSLFQVNSIISFTIMILPLLIPLPTTFYVPSQPTSMFFPEEPSSSCAHSAPPRRSCPPSAITTRSLPILSHRIHLHQSTLQFRGFGRRCFLQLPSKLLRSAVTTGEALCARMKRHVFAYQTAAFNRCDAAHPSYRVFAPSP
jgi:hypothetical protein